MGSSEASSRTTGAGDEFGTQGVRLEEFPSVARTKKGEEVGEVKEFLGLLDFFGGLFFASFFHFLF